MSLITIFNINSIIFWQWRATQDDMVGGISLEKKEIKQYFLYCGETGYTCICNSLSCHY